MKHLLLRFEKWTLLLLALLKPLGFWGAGAIALIDSGTIPVPLDLLIATYVWEDRSHAWQYVLAAAAGSAIGGLIPFLLGRGGGELLLRKRIDSARYERMRSRFERQEFLAMLLPSMLPPPTPWKLFAFASGVFKMRVITFMTAVFAGRLVRFGVTAALTSWYGPQVVSKVGHLAQAHAGGLLTGLGLALLAVAIYALRTGAARRRRSVLPSPSGNLEN